MILEKKFLIKYLDTIIELSKETGMSKNESRTMLDVALANQNPKSVDFNEIKTEIKSFLTINIFSLLCKL
jgi:hypothetical protein|tara:strand:- start:904 stop:1113 length:210 start_codon:yes stop_codon:yes gene_type:complete